MLAWVLGGKWVAVTQYGRTALMWAARNGHAGVVAALVDAGAAVDAVDNMVLCVVLVCMTHLAGGIVWAVWCGVAVVLCS